MARGNFGERLKRERELREVAPQEITNATRISSRYLEALENEDWTRLPGGAFNRGFVRAIARYLGLDEEDLLAEYDLAVGERWAEIPHAVKALPSPSSTWLNTRVALAIAVIVVVLVVASIWGWRRYAAKRRVSHGIFVSVSADPSSVLLEMNEQSRVATGSPGGFGRIFLGDKDLRQARSGDSQPSDTRRIAARPGHARAQNRRLHGRRASESS